MTAWLAALRRVWAARWLWWTLGGLQIALALSLSIPVWAALRTAIGPFTSPGDDQIISTLLELRSVHPTLISVITTSLAASVALGLILAPLVAGATIRRLAGPASPSALAQATIQYFPVAVVLGLYGGLMRVAWAFVAAALGSVHTSLQIATWVLGLTFTAVVVDLARVRAVQHGIPSLHPRAFFAAIKTCVNVGLWLRSGLLSLLQWTLALTILIVAVHGLGTVWAPWLTRGLGLLVVFVALWRVAVAVEFVTTHEQPPT